MVALLSLGAAGVQAAGCGCEHLPSAGTPVHSPTLLQPCQTPSSSSGIPTVYFCCVSHRSSKNCLYPLSTAQHRAKGSGFAVMNVCSTVGFTMRCYVFKPHCWLHPRKSLLSHWLWRRPCIIAQCDWRGVSTGPGSSRRPLGNLQAARICGLL